MLVILPIQSAWSMAAVYCQHEQSVAGKSAHFGHHGHQHQASAQDAPDSAKGDKADKGGKSTLHDDCEVCHHAVQVSVLDHAEALAPAVVAVFAPPPAASFLSHIAEGPPRPNWPSVA